MARTVVGQVVENGKVVSTQYADERFDPLTQTWCWRHRLRLDDPTGNHFTDRDKKLIEKIRLVPGKSYDKKGNVVLSRHCPKCGNTVIVPNSKFVTIAGNEPVQGISK